MDSLYVCILFCKYWSYCTVVILMYDGFSSKRFPTILPSLMMCYAAFFCLFTLSLFVCICQMPQQLGLEVCCFSSLYLYQIMFVFSLYNVPRAIRISLRQDIIQGDQSCCRLLWPPYVIGGPLYFCPVVSIFYLLSFFFPRLISAAGDWISTILPHMVWPQCEFRMQV